MANYFQSFVLYLRLKVYVKVGFNMLRYRNDRVIVIEVI